MKYMGSKARHAKSIIESMSIPPDAIYIEPFVGGANVICDVKAKERIGYDVDIDLIAVLDAASKGWTPPERISESDYTDLKTSKPSALKGYAAFALSYGGKKWGGWCRDREGKRDYCIEAFNNAMEQFPKLIGVKFKCLSFTEIEIPVGSYVYCDPPYAGTTHYSSKFDSHQFWGWVIKNSTGNWRFVSEYTTPDFSEVWNRRVSSSLTADTGAKIATERLFEVKY